MNRKLPQEKLHLKKSKDSPWEQAKGLLITSIFGLFLVLVSHTVTSAVINQITNTIKPNSYLDTFDYTAPVSVVSFIKSIIDHLMIIALGIVSLLIVLAGYRIIVFLNSNQGSDNLKKSLDVRSADIRLIDSLKIIFPKEISDEFIGDLKEKRYQLLKLSTPLWVVYFRVFGWQFSLIWAYYQIQFKQNISQLITHIVSGLRNIFK